MSSPIEDRAVQFDGAAESSQVLTAFENGRPVAERDAGANSRRTSAQNQNLRFIPHAEIWDLELRVSCCRPLLLQVIFGGMEKLSLFRVRRQRGVGCDMNPNMHVGSTPEKPGKGWSG